MTTSRILAYETLRQLREGVAPITLRVVNFSAGADAIAERALIEVSRWQRAATDTVNAL